MCPRLLAKLLDLGVSRPAQIADRIKLLLLSVQARGVDGGSLSFVFLLGGN
jgi:hypothetical protein